jgi:hypothetical protein
MSWYPQRDEDYFEIWKKQLSDMLDDLDCPTETIIRGVEEELKQSSYRRFARYVGADIYNWGKYLNKKERREMAIEILEIIYCGELSDRDNFEYLEDETN